MSCSEFDVNNNPMVQLRQSANSPNSANTNTTHRRRSSTRRHYPSSQGLTSISEDETSALSDVDSISGELFYVGPSSSVHGRQRHMSPMSPYSNTAYGSDTERMLHANNG